MARYLQQTSIRLAELQMHHQAYVSHASFSQENVAAVRVKRLREYWLFY